MLTYEQYYELCKETYENRTRLNQSLYDFTYRVVDPNHFNSDYLNIINEIKNFLDKEYKNPKKIFTPSGVDIKNQPLLRYKNPWDIPRIEELAEIILPEVEKTVFNCNVQAMAVYAYRTKTGNYDEKSVGSLSWHMDNHPKEIIKIMIYLDDVEEQNGAFQVLSKNNHGHKAFTTRIDHIHWEEPCPPVWDPSRFSDEQIEDLNTAGYQPKKLTGPAGTAIIFDNNIIHRATFCEEKTRDVLTFMVKPTIKRIRPYISRKHTGTNYHVDTFVDPEFIGVTKK